MAQKKKKTAKKAAKKTVKKKVSKKSSKKASKKRASTHAVKGPKKKSRSASGKTTKKAASKTTKKAAVAKKKFSSKRVLGGKPQKGIVMVGHQVPDFQLEATGGKTFRLSDLKGRRVVLYFYPKDSTPGCTVEGQDFTQLHERFRANNTEIFGISRDSLKSHENFKAKQNYSLDLLSDPEETVCGLFGVIKEKNMYGRMVLGIERSTFVVDESGRLIKEWRKVKVPGHAQEVLDFIESL